MRVSPCLVAVAALCSIAGLPGRAIAQNVPETTELYKAALPRLESVVKQDFHYAVEEKIERTGVPAALADRVKAHETANFEGYCKAGKFCLKSSGGPDPARSAGSVVVTTPEESFLVALKPGSDPVLVSQGGRDPSRMALRGLGFLEGAFRLPHLDARHLFDKTEFEVTSCTKLAADAAKGIPESVKCEFRRVKPPGTGSELKQLYAESGWVRFVPGRDWAVHDYSYKLSTGMKVEGSVTYQDVPGLDIRTLPKVIEYRYIRSEGATPSVTTTTLTGAIDEVGRVRDRVFTLREYGIKISGRGAAGAGTLIALGTGALVLAFVVRHRGERAGRS